MSDIAPVRFFESRVLRYLPNPLQPTVGVNIGVVLAEVTPGGAGFADARITKNWRMVRAIDPHADIEYLVELERALRAHLNSQAMICSRAGELVSERDWILHMLDDKFSNVLELGSPKAHMADDPGELLQELLDEFCNPTDRGDGTGSRLLSGRSYIKQRMAEEFRLAGVWPYVKRDLKAADFTHKGDDLKIDFAYPFPSLSNLISTSPGTARTDIHLIQAVSVFNAPEDAKVLAFSWPLLKKGLIAAGHPHAALTAVVEDFSQGSHESSDFAKETMIEHGLTVRFVSEAASLAADARRDLRL